MWGLPPLDNLTGRDGLRRGESGMVKSIFRFVNKITAVVFIAACVFVQPEAAQVQPSRSVVFLDERDLTVDFDRILQQERRLTVGIRNNDSKGAQKVELRLVGIVPQVGDPDSKLIKVVPDSVVKELASGQAADFDLTFKEGARPTSGTYEGVLVAMGESGELARRKLILQIKEVTSTSSTQTPAVKPEDPSRIALLPERLKSLTLSGTNFLPSLISQLTPAFFFVGVTLILLWAVLKGIRKTDRNGQIRALREVGSLLAMVWFVLIFLEWGKIIEPPGFHKVEIQSIPLLSQTGDATLGIVAASDGDLGKLARENDQLVVKGIEHAGKYEGSMPFGTNKDFAVIVNVADWWPYAILTIGLGVLLGYGVVNYYKLRRGIDEQNVRATKLWKKIIDDESYYQHDHNSRPYAVARMVELAQEWIALVQADLSASKTDDAKNRLDRLETYANLFARLRVDVDDLFNLEQEVKGRIQEQDFDLKIGSVNSLNKVKDLFILLNSNPFRFSPNGAETEQADKLKAIQTQVPPLVSWLRELRDTHILIAKTLKWARELEDASTSNWTQPQKDKLAEQIDKIEKAGFKALTREQTDLVTCRTETQDAYLVIRNLQEEVEKGFGDILIPKEKAHLIFAAPALSAPEPEALPKSWLCNVMSFDGEKTDCSGDSDDLFTFTALVQFKKPLVSEKSYRWDFDDSSAPVTHTIPAGTVGNVDLKISHRFGAGGKYNVTLLDESGNSRGRWQAMVSLGMGRWERALSAFKFAEQKMTLITGLLTVGSGFLTLYYASPTWGAPADYLKAFLWGSVISEGLKYVSNLVGRLWPAS